MLLLGLDDWLENGHRCQHGAGSNDDCRFCEPHKFCVHGNPLGVGECQECDDVTGDDEHWRQHEHLEEDWRGSEDQTSHR